MDLSDIRRALAAPDLHELREGLLLDVKKCYNLKKSDWQSDFVDDVLCMANTPREHGESAFIILGVSENKVTRACEPEGLDPRILAEYDDAKFQESVHLKIEPTVRFKYVEIQVAERWFGVIEVPPQVSGPYFWRGGSGDDRRWGIIRYRLESRNSSAKDETGIIAWFRQQKADWAACYRANLPAIPDRVLGREGFFNDLRYLMRDSLSYGEARGRVVPWISVHGYPGVGKSTIARGLCHDLATQQMFPDGLLWAELGPEPRLQSILGGWARVWQCADDGSGTTDDVQVLAERLRTALESSHVLLVLDDVWDDAHARDLWVGGSNCAMIVTTRELNVATQLCGSAPRRMELAVLLPDDALALLREFVGGATRANEEGLRELARECGYLPLALLVAAGLLDPELPNSLELSDLLDMVRRGRLLGQRVPGSTRRWEDLPPEMRTVRSVVALSVDRLGAEERRRFGMLGVFARNSRFDASALTAVWGVADILPTATELVRRGLVRWHQPWYSIHALMRDYAGELLEESSADRRDAERRHAEHYLGVFSKARDLLGELYDPVNPEALDKGLQLFDEASANVQAAWQWSSDHMASDSRAAEICSLLARGGSRLSTLRQAPRERITWLEAGLRACDHLCDGTVQTAGRQAEHLLWLGSTRHSAGDHEQSLQALRSSAEIYDRIGHRGGFGLATRFLGDVYLGRQDPPSALDLYEEAAEASHDAGDDRNEGIALHNVAAALMCLGRVSEARERLLSRLEITRRMGDRGAEASSLQSLAGCAQQDGDLGAALGYLEQAIAILEESDHAFRELGLSSSLYQLAEVRLLAGDEQRAATSLEAALRWRQGALRQRRTWQWDRGVGEDAVRVAVILRRLGRPEEALDYASESVTVASRISHDMLRGGALYQRGLAHRDIGEERRDADHLVSAVRDLLAAHEAYKGSRGWQAGTAQDLGLTFRSSHEVREDPQDLLSSREWYERAAALWEAEWQDRGASDAYGITPRSYALDPASQAVYAHRPARNFGRCHLEIARLLRKQGDLDGARHHVELASQAMDVAGQHADREAVFAEAEALRSLQGEQ